MTISAQPPGTRGNDGADAHPSPDEPIRADPSAPSGGIDGMPATIENGAISDARRHARRRRAGYALIVAASTLAVAASTFAVIGGSTDSPARAPDPDQRRIPAAPVNSATANVIAVWARIHVGWIYVYDDGRVLSYPDSGPISERRLSTHGLDLVRRGTLAPQNLLLYRSTTAAPAEVWSDPIPDAYRPDQYAVCNLNVDATAEKGDVLSDVGSIRHRLPAHAQALLSSGEVKSFTDDFVDENGDFIGPDGFHGQPGSGVGCVVLSPAQTRTFWAFMRAPEGSGQEDGELLLSDTTIAELHTAAESTFVFLAMPILPHGGWVLWGG